MPIFAAIPAIVGGVAAAAPAISGLVGAGTAIAGAVSGSNTAGKTQGQVNNLYQPYNQAGIGALNQINTLLSPGNNVLSTLQAQPGYQAGFDQGMVGQERAQAAAGTLNSGGTLKASTRYGQDYATNQYQNILNNLYKVAGLGENSLGPLADNYASGNASQNAALNQGIGGVASLFNPLAGGVQQPTTPYAPVTSSPFIPANTNNPLSLDTTLPKLSFGGI
jgi:hypothetical protein